MRVRTTTPSTAATTTLRPAAVVVDLDDERSADTSLVGAKAGALARARGAGLPTLPGFVVTTAVTAGFAADSIAPEVLEPVRAAWSRLSDDGQLPLVVRSSSTSEDGKTQSMAGLFTSVLDVRGWEQFVHAVDKVLASGGDSPIAVLVQPFIEPAWGGVLFGADPVTGRANRLVVAAVPGGPDRLVSGQVDGAQLALSPRGKLLEAGEGTPAGLRSRRTRRVLARLARRTASTFGGPQDVEWAIDHDGSVVLLQSRPITAVGEEARATGPVFGPGPVAETLGSPLGPLEEDLWVTPLRQGLREALVVAGAVSPRRLRNSPIVVTVGGRVAADLELLGVTVRRRGFFARLDPRPPARRLRAAWRVGRLKVALPTLATDLVDEVDADLRSVPELTTLSKGDLIRLLRRSHQTLVALHGHEVLAGLLLDDDRDNNVTAASAALRVLAAAAAAPPVDDAALIARHPVLLSLVPPSISTAFRLPPAPTSLPGGSTGVEQAPVREALRLRVRWVQELTAHAALRLGAMLTERGILPSSGAVSRLDLDELAALTEGGGGLVLDLRDTAEPGPPLPAAFRLTDGGAVVPVNAVSGEGGRGAGGGRGSGPVHVGDGPPAPGSVLVVRTLDPGLAANLPDLAGLVAETGSVLSHLAILAREYGVPTVVALPGALERFTPGTWVVVDGTTGEVSALEAEEWGAA